jgi:hypothetical protein
MRAGHEKGFPRERRIVFSPSSVPDFARLVRSSVRTGRFFIRRGAASGHFFVLAPSSPHRIAAVVPRILVAVAALAAGLGAPARAAGTSAFVSPRPAATLTGGSVAEVRWSGLEREALGRDADEAELVLSLDGGRTFPVRVSAELDPRATGYRWRVPSVPTASARLAVRVGAAHERGRERIVLISAPFAIAADSSEPGTLAAGPDESWTEQALCEGTPRDRLGAGARPDPARLVAREGGVEADDPSFSVLLAAPASNFAPPASSRAVSSASSRTSSRFALAPTPLRL